MKDLSTYRDETMGFFGDVRKSMHHFFNDYIPAMRSHPNMDVREEENRYVVEAEIPGMAEKDIDVSVHNDMLSISSKHEETTEEKRKGYIMKERRSSSFSRHFSLPDDADREHIDASYNQGLLTLTIPKIAQEKQIRHIKVAKPEKLEKMDRSEAQENPETPAKAERTKKDKEEK